MQGLEQERGEGQVAHLLHLEVPADQSEVSTRSPPMRAELTCRPARTWRSCGASARACPARGGGCRCSGCSGPSCSG